MNSSFKLSQLNLQSSQQSVNKKLVVLFVKLIYDNKYKLVMQEGIANSCKYVRNIGKSNDLQNIVCTASRDMRVCYSQEKRFSRENYHINEKTKYVGIDQDTPQKFNRTSQTKSVISRPQKTNQRPQKVNDECDNENQEYFWPIDIVQDQTGNAVRQLKSYIQTHKVNTYIKLKLTQTQNSSKKLNLIRPLIKIIQKLLNKTKQESLKKIKQFNQKSKLSHQMITNLPLSSLTSNFDQSGPQQLEKLNLKNFQNKSSCTRSKRSRSENNMKSSSNRIIRIDYQVITIPNNKSNKTSRIIYYQSPKNQSQVHNPQQYLQNEHCHKQFIRSNSNYNMHPSNVGHSHHNANKNQQQNGSSSCLIPIPTNSLIKYKTLDLHEKQYLTPNTSTYFNTISQQDYANSQHIRSRSGSRSINTNTNTNKNRNRNKNKNRNKNRNNNAKNQGYEEKRTKRTNRDNQQSGYQQDQYQYNSNNQQDINNINLNTNKNNNNNKNKNRNMNTGMQTAPQINNNNRNIIDKIYRNKLIQINNSPALNVNVNANVNVNPSVNGQYSVQPRPKRTIIGLTNNFSA